MYLVTGGSVGIYDYLSSTEVLTKGGNSWQTIGSLPRALTYLRAVSIDDSIIVTGNTITEVSNLTCTVAAT